MKPNPHDPHHVTLHLIQNHTSRIMQLEADILQEREKRRDVTTRCTAAERDFEQADEERIYYHTTLKQIAELRGKGAGIAAAALEIYPEEE